MGKIQQFKDKIRAEAKKAIKDLPRDMLMEQFINDMKRRQIQWTAKGSPITEDEMTAGVTEEWKGAGHIYRRAGIALDDLIAAGKLAIADTSGVQELPPVVQKIKTLVEKIGRNQRCPCGSGLKFKKCCGR